jgi:hypothetical protein
MEFIMIAFAAAFAVIWLITYIPLSSVMFGKIWSPRLKFCNLLIPMDVGLTLVLICGGWIGITTASTGIGMVTYNVFTGIGISVAVASTRKFIIPRWQQKFDILCAAHKESKQKGVITC